MALFNCPECGGKVSDTRDSCPHCGALFEYEDPVDEELIDLQRRRRHRFLLFLSAGVLVILGMIQVADYVDKRSTRGKSEPSAILKPHLERLDSLRKKEQRILEQAQSGRIMAGSVLSYDVKERDDVSYAGTPRMVYRIVLRAQSLPDRNDMQTTAEKIWSDNGRDYSEFTVFMYMPGMDWQSVAYGIGEFRSTGMIKFEVQDFALTGTRWK